MAGLSKSMREASRRLVVVVVIAAALALVEACAGAQAPATAPKPAAESPASAVGAQKDTVEKLVEGAKKEGKLSVYYSLDDDNMDALMAGFQKTYPFLSVERYRAGGEAMAQKVVAEARAGQHLADVAWTSGSRFSWIWAEKILQPYDSPERKAFPPGALGDNWVGAVTVNTVMAYNTNLVKKEDAPKTWADLADPKWKGKMIHEATNVTVLDGLMETVGKEKAIEIYKGIAKNQPSIRRGHDTLAGQLAAGEMPLTATAYIYSIEALRKKGAPVDWVRTNPVFGEVMAMAILARAPNPNAAKLFVDYTISQEGQQILAGRGRVVARPGMQTQPPGLVDDINFLFLSPTRDAKLLDELVDLQRDLLGIK